MTAASKLAGLSREEREKLDPFPIISPQADEAIGVRYKVGDSYIIAKPYDRIYHEKGTIFMDIGKAFTQKAGARGTLLIGPKASGKTHLLGVEIDLAKNRYNAKVILVSEKEYDFTRIADINIRRDEARHGIIKTMCRKLGAAREDIDGLVEELDRRGWNAVQVVIDDLYEGDWGRKDIVEDILTLFKLHTRSKPPTIRTSAAFHTSENAPASRFFDLYRDELVLHTIQYDDGNELALRIVGAMLRGEVIPGATVVPLVTGWHQYVDEEVIEDAFKDFFSKYVSTVGDEDLRGLRVEDIAGESFIIETVIKATRFGAYRVFAEESRRLWYTYNGDNVEGGKTYIDTANKYRELIDRRGKDKPHHFYKTLLEDTVNKIMSLRGAQLRETRKYVVEGGKVRWRRIEYYAVDGEEIVAIIPQLTTRRSGIVVERPEEIERKIADIAAMMPRAQIVGIVTEDVDDRGLRSALGRDRYALIKLPPPKDSKLKYAYAQLLSGALSPAELRSWLERYAKPVPGSRESAVRAFIPPSRRS